MAKVKLENGKSVAMSELQKGDRVQTGIDSHFTSCLSLLKNQSHNIKMIETLKFVLFGCLPIFKW